MADARRYGIGAQLDIEQILLEAQHRWLRPAEICEILRNYKNFHIASEPGTRPPSGSLFLFDRKVLRYFRKDGYNWRKKKDGKTVKEAHERLKAGSIDVLHCYYAHGEEDEHFQRRSYWMLEEELSHIVLVHYREVKGNRTNFNRIKETEEASPVCLQAEENVTNSEVDSSMPSKFHPYSCQGTSQTTDTTGFSSAQASEYEDAESAYNNQASSTSNSLLELQTPGVNKLDAGIAAPYYPAPLSDDYQGKYPAISEMDLVPFAQGDRGKNSYDAGLNYQLMKSLDLLSWDNVLENSAAGIQSTPFKPSHSSAQIDSTSIMSQQVHDLLVQANTNGIGKVQESGSYPHGQDHWQVPHGDSSAISKWSVEQKRHANLANNLNSRFPDGEISSVDSLNSLEPTFPAGQYMHPPQNVPVKLTNVETGSSQKSVLQSNLTIDGITEHSALKQPVLDGISKEGLRKLDSFDRWMSKELGDVSEPHMQSTSGSYWETMGNEDGVDDSDIGSQVHMDAYMLSPSISQDQLFSIIDFSPSWAYSESEIKVLITGRFLKSQQDSEKFKWACMFGEVEVPAEVLADGVLRCYTPSHKAGRVPFYVTCSNRLACSELREFEFRVNEIPDVNIANIPSGSSSEAVFYMRFEKLLSLESSGPQVSVPSTLGDHAHLISKINSLLKEDHNEWEKMLKFTSQGEFSAERAREQLLSKLLKERLREWLLKKIAEGGKGACILDEEGQGVLHFAAALGYDWAILPTIAAGVSVNFRDVNGWTALHWAASHGRERTVAFLISLGAAPGALTDPTQYSSGRTPADLASSSGHKGIAGYLAESSLSSHLQLLGLKEIKEGNDGVIKPVQTVSERAATVCGVGDLPLKDSLAAVCNATQAAARIHQVFRVQSFQMKQVKEYGGSGLGMSDERALSLLAVKTNIAGQHDEPVHAAAIRIQNKFRSWKGRKDFLIIREHIVKIQAHVRGHQVRKNYKKIIWSVGILDKVILRWRRKGTGLRGFKSEALAEGTSTQVAPPKEDDYDFLKEGKKQTEERLQKALTRVKSMVQYPEARDQYRRLLNVVSEMQEKKSKYDRILNSFDDTADINDDLNDLEALLDNDTVMSAEP